MFVLCLCVYVVDAYILGVLLMSGLSEGGVVVCMVGQPLMFVPGEYGLVSFGLLYILHPLEAPLSD